MKRELVPLLLLASAALVACGGGGGENSAAATDANQSAAATTGSETDDGVTTLARRTWRRTETTTVPAPTTSPTSPTTTTPSTGTTTPPVSTGGSTTTVATLPAKSTCGIADFQKRMMERINAARAVARSCGGTFYPAVAPLSWNDKLFAAAAAHSADMVNNNLFSHTGSDGSSAGTRMTRAGYNWGSYTENISASYHTVDRTVDGWLGSPGHCANIMSARVTEMGAACVLGTANTQYDDYWTLVEGRPR
ncbi:MAG: hypothetical protein JWP36_1745 [Paucimonas sp.]|nr:hypothetical protein [Paucimonas sp.]